MSSQHEKIIDTLCSGQSDEDQHIIRVMVPELFAFLDNVSRIATALERIADTTDKLAAFKGIK